MSNAEKLLELVRAAIAGSTIPADLNSLHFLAAGEYTYNFRVTLEGIDAVFRVVTGSQMGLGVPEQALYEAHALQILAPTGKVPTLIRVEPETRPIGYPYLVETYLPGRPLNYQTDLVEAARCVATIHRCMPSAGHRLQLHRDPVGSILDETAMLVDSLRDSKWDAVKALRERVDGMTKDAFEAVRADPAIINTDLNSHNFIVDDGRVSLIDWEKARIGPSLMDIAHFLLPTTTLWRDATATRLSEEQRETFLHAYIEARPGLEPEGYRAALHTALQLATVRAISWCAWSLAASERGERPIENEETLQKSLLFTSSDFLRDLVDELWG
jgi:thiamine kinase-like enzyme